MFPEVSAVMDFSIDLQRVCLIYYQIQSVLGTIIEVKIVFLLRKLLKVRRAF